MLISRKLYPVELEKRDAVSKDVQKTVYNKLNIKINDPESTIPDASFFNSNKSIQHR